jgi:hypothetical protein
MWTHGVLYRVGPGSNPGQITWDLWWTKWHWDRFSPSTTISLAKSHSTDCSTFIIIHHPGLGTIGQLVADVPSGLCLTAPKEKTADFKELLIDLGGRDEGIRKFYQCIFIIGVIQISYLTALG